MDAQNCFGTFRKNELQNIKVSLVQEDGLTEVDIRQWMVTRESEFPTKKGVRFDVAKLSNLRKVLDEIVLHLERNKD